MNTAAREMILSPGEYLVELEFERPVEPDTLNRALTGMGWGLVVFDQAEPNTQAARTGAVSRSSLSSASSAAPVTRAAMPLQTRSAPMITAVAPRVVAQAAAINPARVPVASAAPLPRPAPAATPSPRSSIAIQDQAKLPSYVAPAVVMKPKPPAPGARAFSPGDTFTPKKPEPPPDGGAEPTYADPGPATSPGGGGGGGGGGGYSAAPGGSEEQVYADEAAYAPTENAAMPAMVADSVEAIKAALVDLWRRWKEWGSPFAMGPSQSVQTSGQETRTRLRFVGQLHQALSLNDVPGLLRWLFVKRLGVPTFTDLSLAYKPHPLVHGHVYEMRFLSRAKSEATKEAVKKGLGAMGFLPMKLFALKRNMRMPGRPGASLTLWYGIAQWGNVDSLVVGDDPFFFEDVREVT